MSLTQILVFLALSLLSGWFQRMRRWALLTASVLAMYWLQPVMPVRRLDFWLPTVTLGLAVIVWAGTQMQNCQSSASNASEGQPKPPFLLRHRLTAFFSSENSLAAMLITGLVLLVAATRYLGPVCCLTPTRPPEIGSVLAGLTGIALLAAIGLRWPGGRWASSLVWGLLGLFIVLKTPALAQAASAGLRMLNAQDASLASSLDIRWLGFSYVAFRLLHTLRDRLVGRLPGLGLGEFVTYVIFFPAFTAGPIDRVQRFTQDLRQPFTFSGAQAFEGGRRIATGVFKKFVLADSLALIALNEVNATQALTSWGLWLLLYAYALRIYFDFSGYTDIAIGLGRLTGIALPENFERPYLKPNLTTFWNSWHITLAQWFRAYYFNPLTRALRTRQHALPMWGVILIGQVSTMLLIGLWHGVTWNFAAWGLWHGLGLFVHNRWTEATRARLSGLVNRPRLQRALAIIGTVFTFHYVVIGWVWFGLPDIRLAGHVFLRLFGLTG